MNKEQEAMSNWKQWYDQQQVMSEEWYRADMTLNISLMLIGAAIGVMFMMLLMLAGV